MRNTLLLLLAVSSLSGCWPAVVGGGAVAATSAVLSKDRTIEQTAEDMRIAAHIRSELASKKLYSKVDVQVAGGRVMYTGFVANVKDVIDAMHIAWKERGVNEVVNELRISEDSNHFNAKQYTKDTLITSAIKAKSLVEKDVRFSNFTVVTTDGVVYLFGIARSHSELNKVKSIAKGVEGVKRVVSHVNIK